MPSADDLLAAYDAQLRTEAETPSAVRVDRLGPLRLVTFGGGRGFITYADLAGADAATLRGWVGEALAYFRDQPEITRVEWKTRGHDVAPGLHESLLEKGFAPDEPESVMIGETRLLAIDVVLPEGVSLRRVSDEPDVRAMCVMESIAFGDDDSEEIDPGPATPTRTGRRDGAVGGRGGGSDHQCGPTRTGGRHRLRRPVGRRHPAAVAPSWHLPRSHRGSRPLSTGPGEDAAAQRLDRVLPSRSWSGRD